MRRTVWIIILLVFGLAAFGAGWWWLDYQADEAPSLRTMPVKRGDLLATISATGTVVPEEVINVGAQIAGMIRTFGQDKDGKTVDYGSVVEEGTVLARIDESLYAAAVETARAQLMQAEANKLSAEANVLQMKAKLLQAEQDWDRAQRLGPSSALARSSYDQFRANFEVAKANLAAADAAVEQSKAALAQARASLTTALTNLGYCTIKSPVKGVIIDRRVNIGQTVVASLSAPSLFLIAKDLRRITVWVSVNEADIGQIYKDQPVTFTADAYPGREFHGQVRKVRLNAAMTQNVVTYTVEVITDNDDGKLLPYLTANVRFETGRRKGVLLVPNAALRWTPQTDQIAPEARRTEQSSPADSSRQDEGAGSDPLEASPGSGTVWVEQEGFVRPVSVNIGLTDGSLTELEGKGLTEGLRVVVGELTPEETAEMGMRRSPLMPQPRPGRRQSQRESAARPVPAPIGEGGKLG